MDFIDIPRFNELRDKMCLIDVRTPSEFLKGHIKGAINVPLFNDDERVVVGTLYKQKGQQVAVLKGLDFVGPKMSTIIKQIRKACMDQLVVVQCWRGGKRSQSVAWLLDFYGIKSVCIQGGYRAYRRALVSSFELNNFNLVLLGGLTGSGKTKFLQAYNLHDAQVIDLEELANHKGSAFGALGENEQISNEQFSNDLYEMFLSLDSSQRIWLESESKSIGKNIIPDEIWKQMLLSQRVELCVPHEARLNNLIELYGEFPKEGLLMSFDKIQKRLGGKRYQDAVAAIENNDYRSAADIALSYYDTAYAKSREKAGHKQLFLFEYDGVDHVKGIQIMEQKLLKLEKNG